jgi:hypothetical protein
LIIGISPSPEPGISKSEYQTPTAAFDDDVLPRFDPIDRIDDIGRAFHNLSAEICRQDNDRNTSSPQILLRIDVLVACDQNVKAVTLGKLQKLSIRCLLPRLRIWRD